MINSNATGSTAVLYRYDTSLGTQNNILKSFKASTPLTITNNLDDYTITYGLDMTDMYTKTEVNSLLSGKQDYMGVANGPGYPWWKKTGTNPNTGSPTYTNVLKL